MSAKAPLVIVGAGDQGRVILDLLSALGEEPLGFVEPSAESGRAGTTVDGLVVLGDLSEPQTWLDRPGTRFVSALGDNLARKSAYDRCVSLGMVPVSVIHPAATLLGRCRIDAGAVVCAGAVIGLAAHVGPNVIINTAASIDHDNDIRPHATIAPGAHLAGRVTVGVGAFVGIGASVREGTTIGAWSTVAGGAMVIGDVRARTRVAGVPARPMSEAL